MKWHNLRHALFLKSSDFLAMLALIHVLKFMLVGFGVIRNAQDIQDIQQQVWALITGTILFAVCLAGSKRGYSSTGVAGDTDGEKTYSRFHKFFLPAVLFVSVVDLIAMSAFHGIITVLALHLVLISFSLTGFSCILLVLLNLVGVLVGTAFHLLLVRRLYSDLGGMLGHTGIAGPTSLAALASWSHNSANWTHGQHRLTELTTNYGYGLASKTSIVIVDMVLLLLQIVGGVVFYSRFWKMGSLMARYRTNPAYYVGEFPLLVRLEQVIFSFFGGAGFPNAPAAGPGFAASLGSGLNLASSTVYEEESGGLAKKVVGSAVHTRPLGPLSPNSAGAHFHSVGANNGLKQMGRDLGGELVEDEVEDDEWLRFLEKNEAVKTMGKRTYSTEPIQLNYAPTDMNQAGDGFHSPYGSASFYADPNLSSFGTLSSLYSAGMGTNRLGTAGSLGANRMGTGSRLSTLTSTRFGTMATMKQAVPPVKETVSTSLPLSTTTSISEAQGGLKNSTMVRFNTKPFNNVQSEFLMDVASREYGSASEQALVAEDGYDLSASAEYGHVHSNQDYYHHDGYSNSHRTNNNPLQTANSGPYKPSRSPSATRTASNSNGSEANSVEGDSTDREGEMVERRVESSSLHSRALNSPLNEDKLMNISVELHNPMAKLVYLILPSWAKRVMKRLVLSSSALARKRELVRTLRWSGARSLPHFNALQLFSYEQYEWLYVKWMHSFNRWFYNATLFEVIVIIFYSLTGTILLSYRHYLTLSESDKELYIGKTSRLVSLAVRFILYPIISLILIISVVYILLNPSRPSNAYGPVGGPDKGSATTQANAVTTPSDRNASPPNSASTPDGGANSASAHAKSNKPGHRRKRRERILGVYWLMILLCLVDFLGSLFDVFISLGLETPPYAVHNSLVMQYLMTKTAAFLLLRFPTLFILYLVYFVGLFASQFFLNHTNTLRFVTMQLSSQLVIGIGSWSFLIRPIDLNRRKVFSEVILPYVLYLSNFVK